MFCPNCGKEVAEADAFCRFCGRSLSADKPAPQTTSIPVQVGTPEQRAKRSGEATASLILGLFSFVPVVGLLAVIFGHMARASIRRSGGRLLGEGMAGVGLLLGYLSLAAWSIYVILAFIVPSLGPSRIEANEMSAVGSLRTVDTAAITYASTYDAGYPPSLAALGPPKKCQRK